MEMTMTKTEAQKAMDQHVKVEAGTGEDHDRGYVHEIVDDETALIGWDSGVRTPCAIADLSFAS
jgi:hypothetical protein